MSRALELYRDVAGPRLREMANGYENKVVKRQTALFVLAVPGVPSFRIDKSSTSSYYKNDKYSNLIT